MGINIARLRLSDHAIAAIADREVRPELIANALLSPSEVYEHDGDRLFCGPLIAVVVAGPDEAAVVKTVLLRARGGRRWTDEEFRAVMRKVAGE